MTDRLDRIERLQEIFSVNQAQIQASQQSTQIQLDQFGDRMDATLATIADLATRQAITQTHLDRVDNRMDGITAVIAALTTRQTITQNQIDSLMALSADTNRSIANLGFRSVNHEGRLEILEGQGEVE